MQVDGNGFETQFRYDDDRNLLSKTDSQGNTAFYEYNDFGKVVTAYIPHDKDDTSGNTFWIVTTNSYDAETGNLLKTTVADEKVTAFQTDATHPLGILFDTDENPVVATEVDLDKPIEQITEYSYDDYGNVIEVAVGSASATPGEIDVLSSTQYKYDILGLNVVQGIGPEGNLTRYDYDDLGRMVVRTDPRGNSKQYQYDMNGQIIGSVDKAGGVTTFEYTPIRQLRLTIDHRGGVTEQVYAPARDLVDGADVVEVIDPMEYSTQNEYDSLGNLIKTIDPNGNETHYRYDELNRLVETIDPGEKSVLRKYDGVGNLVEITDRFGNSTFFEYDSLRRLSKKIDAEGRVTVFEYNIRGDIKSEKRITSYDVNGDPEFEITDPSDPKEYVGTVYTYNERGLRETSKTEVKSDVGGTPSYKYRNEQEFNYDTLGRLIEEIALFEGDNYSKTVFIYDKSGRAISRSVFEWDGVSSWEGTPYISELTTYDENGTIASITDGRGVTHTFSYDPMGRQISDSVTVVLDDDVLRGEASEIGLSSIVTERRVLTDYDEVGNVVRKRETSVQGTGGTEVGHTLSDTSLTYNLRNELVTVSDSNGGMKVFTYDGNRNKVSEIDQAGNVTRTYFDSFNRKIGQEDALGNLTLFEYDIPPLDESDGYSYMTAVVSPLGARTTRGYNRNGELVQVSDALPEDVSSSDDIGNNISYQYDCLGRVILESIEEKLSTGGKVKTTTYEYDDAENTVTTVNMVSENDQLKFINS